MNQRRDRNYDLRVEFNERKAFDQLKIKGRQQRNLLRQQIIQSFETHFEIKLKKSSPLADWIRDRLTEFALKQLLLTTPKVHLGKRVDSEGQN